MKRILYATVICAGLVAGCDDGVSDDTSTTRRDTTPPTTTTPPRTPPPTTTTPPATRTPTDQGNSARDTEITAGIRKAVVGDDTMSMNARNVKIITVNGVVTLEGVVDTQAEKDAIDAKARAVPGVVRVDNRLEVEKP